MIYLLVVVASILIAPGCSPAQRIAESSQAIRLEASALAEHGKRINDTFVVSAANRIDLLAGGIAVDLSGVEDKTPAWIGMMVWIAIAAVLVASAVILWQTGIGTAIRVAIGWIPRRKAAAAALAVDMLDPSSPEGDREYIAAQRAQDPLFDAAYRRAKKQKEATP
jgi:hypothetical protein